MGAPLVGWELGGVGEACSADDAELMVGLVGWLGGLMIEFPQCLFGTFGVFVVVRPRCCAVGRPGRLRLDAQHRVVARTSGLQIAA